MEMGVVTHAIAAFAGALFGALVMALAAANGRDD